MMSIYLQGKEGDIRIAYTDAEAALHEKAGFKRVDINEVVAAKKAELNPPPKKRAVKRVKK